MRDVIGRHLEEQGAPKPHGDLVLDVLEKVVAGIRTGTDISGVQAEVTKLISNQESRSQLLDSLMMAHDYDRLVKYARARSHIESLLLAAAQRGDLSPTEALAFMATITAESKIIQTRVKSGATSVKDIVDLLEKADYAVTSAQEDLGKKFSKTTPQGREIVRRLIHKLSKTTLESQAEKAPGAKRIAVQEE